ncbi:transcription and mRNA export factor ENY2 isoform X2 [Brachionus plicatilis]|uniref:Transcription and mRNA export factor ENY2 n=1 Tax=Brachionus plicatilis TaxID=10195 RepID=A0A3M7Q2X0_BRAPC|nr:transcription and mRNA export factor ENY2 isoform X2 [Brachionus plicatilis]
MSREQNNTIRNSINAKLIETGERERLREALQLKLVECGWTKEVTAHCQEIVKKRGFENISIDELVAELVPKSRALVPNQVKKELLESIRLFLAKQNNL